MMSHHHSTNSQHPSRPARVPPAHTALKRWMGWRWKRGDGGPSRAAVQNIHHLQLKGQRKRKGRLCMHVTENEDVFNPPKQHIQVSHNRQNLDKQSSYLGQRKFFLQNSISKSALCPTPRDYVASSTWDNSNSSHKSSKVFVILNEWQNKVLDNPTSPKPIARHVPRCSQKYLLTNISIGKGQHQDREFYTEEKFVLNPCTISP